MEPDEMVDEAEMLAMYAEWQARPKWDDSCGYDLDDPKHPTYAERMADKIDEYRMRKKEGEA